MSDVIECDLLRGEITFSNPIEAEGLFVRVQDIRREWIIIPCTTEGSSLHFDLLETGLPIRSLEVLGADDKEFLKLKDLYHANDKEFQGKFAYKRDRPNDPLLELFIGKQTFEYFTGAIGYRVAAAVVSGYKAIEIRDESYLENAEKMLLRALVILPSGALSGSPRNNREHLHVSVLTTLWHLYLVKGDVRNFVRTITSLRALLDQRGFQSYFNLAVNMGKSTRTLTLLYQMSGQVDEASRIVATARELFQMSVRDATSNLQHFRELRYFHNDVYESMRLVREEVPLQGEKATRELRGSVRIQAEEHPEVFAVMWQTFQAAVRELSAPAVQES